MTLPPSFILMNSQHPLTDAIPCDLPLKIHHKAEKCYHLVVQNGKLTCTLSPTFTELIAPITGIIPTLPPLESGSNHPLQFTYAHQLKSLIYCHVEEHTSANALLQAMNRDPFLQCELVPKEGLGNSTFYEANNTRGVIQTIEVFNRLAKKVSRQLRIAYAELGELVAVDGSLIDATLSMAWADYSSTKNKAKVHVGFDLNYGIPQKLILTDGKGNERLYLPKILKLGQTGVTDRGYQDHHMFDHLIEDGKHFVARIRSNTRYEIIKELSFEKGSSIFFFAEVKLGDNNHRMAHPVRLVGFTNQGKLYWVITDRTDLSAERIAAIFSLRWEIEKFFFWWKTHMNVYWLMFRSESGLLLQLLTGMITYMLFVLYCSKHFDERPSINRLRELRWRIRTEATISLIFHYLQYCLPPAIFKLILQWLTVVRFRASPFL